MSRAANVLPVVVCLLFCLLHPSASMAQEGRSYRTGVDSIAARAVTTPTVLNRVFSKQEAPANCVAPTATDSYTERDPRLYLWLQVAGVRAGDEWSILWGFPGGRTDRWNFTFNFTGYGCVWVAINLNASDRFGDWNITFQVNRVTVGGPYLIPVLGPNQPRINRVEPYVNPTLGRVSPNGWAVLHGVRFAAEPFPEPGNPLPTEAAGVRVLVNDVPARLAWATGSTVDFQIPAGVRGDSVVVRLLTPRGGSNIVRVPLTTVSPGIIPHGQHAGMADVIRAGTSVSPSAPVQRGDIITIQATGLGPVARAPRDGQRGAAPTDTHFRPSVYLGGVSLEVLRATMADFPGWYYVTVRVPPEVPSGGAVPLHLTINGVSARPLTLPVGGPAPSFSKITVDRVEHPAWGGPSRDNGIYNPAGLVILTASNLRPNAPTYIRCSGANGYDVRSPVVSVSGNTATAIVPPYFDPRSGAYLSGTVSCALTQKMADQDNVSPAFALRIQTPPVPRGAPGTLTLALLQSATQGAQRVQANLTLKDRGSAGRAYSAANTRAETNATVAAYSPYIDAVRRISNGSATSVTVGSGAFGIPLIVTRDDLVQMDRWLMMLMAEAESSAANGEISTAAAPSDARIRPNAFVGSLIQLLKDCINPASWASYTLGMRGRSPEESCTAAEQAIKELPSAASGALVEAIDEVSAFIERVEAAVHWLPIPGVSQARVIVLVGRMAGMLDALKMGAAVLDRAVVGIAPGRPEDRERKLRESTAKLVTAGREYLVDAVMGDPIEEVGKAVFGEEAWNLQERLDEAREFPAPARWSRDKLASHPAEMLAPVAVGNADGSYSLVTEPPPGPLSVISGRVSLVDGQPVRDGYVELGEGSQVTVPFAVAATNPDGTFKLIVPTNQLGSTIPTSASVIYNIPRSGTSSYQIFNGGTVNVGSSNMNLAPAVLNPNAGNGGGGGGTGGGGAPCVFACRAD